MSDEWPDEPEEEDPEARWGDPEARWGDPERDLPSIPEVATPDAESASASASADPELMRLFWASVVAGNVALLGLALGPMLVYFRGDWDLGAASVAVGAFALYRTTVYYGRVRARRSDANGSENDDPARTADGAGDDADGGGGDTN